ncbi:MAG: SAM-dependent methyltransferase [Odoribacter sp.]|nr:SAM-dependent methyltransferase [Odoribacter sp.]
MGKIYLIPNLLGETAVGGVIPAEVIALIRNIRVFASENPKNTRRFLKKADPGIRLEERTFLELNEHSGQKDIEACLPYLAQGDVGIISEAGCPGIADPGAELVALAHRHGYPVVPLVGPSSILLALIASGLNGQTFSFNGYLPVKAPERAKALRNYERQSAQENRTQIFIETPYRNQKLLEEMLQTLHPRTLLSIACDLTTPAEYIQTLPVQEWKNRRPELHKRPAIFLFHASGR